MMTLSLVITALITLIHFPSSSYADNEQYLNCSKPFDWAGVGDLSYPFWGVSRPSYCGHPGFELNCIDDVPHIKMTDINYQVLHVDNVSRTLKVARKDYWNTVCPATFVNTTINSTVFDYNSATTNLTLFYDCPVSSIYQADSTPFNCSINGTDATNYYFKNTNLSSIGNPLGTCKYNVKVPVLQSAAQTGSNLTEAALIQAIDGGFMLGWDANNMLCDGCKATGGQCGYNTSTSEFACYCVNGTFPFTCHVSPIRQQSSKSNWGLKIAIGISVAVAGTVMISFVIIYGIKRGHFSSNSMVRWQIDSKNDHFNTEEILRSNELLAPKRYTYSNLKNITNSFKEKVGQGGYGDVYKGELPDGRMVAVKILSASKGNGEQFINEVASITRTSHVNVVTLLGFCYEMTKRALIYEFMPNGSLDKVIYDKGSPITNNHLDTKKMFQIAIGIARGLEYLHRGCNTRILHFDIKPHNILLDEDFHPKISDFGLAKLCSTKESIVSMKGMRGTIGYIAPEVFSRCFGGVSHKSDVYSYGMLVLEMVGGRKNFDGGLSQTSETYFPHWIYNKLQQGESFETFRDLTNEEEDTLKKMIIVSLWCTQTSPLDRPSMGKVIEMLEGSLQSLQFPPKPVMHSPVRSPQDCFTTSQSQNPTS